MEPIKYEKYLKRNIRKSGALESFIGMGVPAVAILGLFVWLHTKGFPMWEEIILILVVGCGVLFGLLPFVVWFVDEIKEIPRRKFLRSVLPVTAPVDFNFLLRTWKTCSKPRKN